MKANSIGKFIVAGYLSWWAALELRADPLDYWHWRNPLPQGNPLNRAIYGSGCFVAVGELGTILTSADGVTWARSNFVTDGALSDIAYDNDLFVAVGAASRGISFSAPIGVIVTSPDGIVWTRQTVGDYTLSGVASGNGLFVAVGS